MMILQELKIEYTRANDKFMSFAILSDDELASADVAEQLSDVAEKCAALRLAIKSVESSLRTK